MFLSFFMVLDSFAANYIGSPPPAWCKGSARRMQCGKLAWPMLSRSLHSYSQLQVCEYKVTKNKYALQAFFQFIPNYFWISHFLIFCKILRACKINCKAISESSFLPDIPDFQAFSAPWTFLRGNSDFPLTKPPLSPNETPSFPKALSAPGQTLNISDISL